MKKFYFIVLAVFSFISGHSQYIIPKIGIAMTYNTENQDSYKTKPRAGLVAGLGYSTRLSNRLSFQPEIYYVQKSFKFDYTTYGNIDAPGTYSFSEKYAIGYIEVPVMIKVKLYHEKFFVIGGPSLAFGVGGSYSFDHITTYDGQAPIPSSGSGNVRFKARPQGAKLNDKYFDRQDILGAQFGIGYVLMEKIFIEARANFSFVDLIRDRNSRNQSFMITAAIPISLHHRDIE